MKRQLLLSLTLSLLAANAFALPAAEQATPQSKAEHSVFSQTVAEGVPTACWNATKSPPMATTALHKARPLPKAAVIAWKKKAWLKMATTVPHKARSLPKVAVTVSSNATAQ